MSALADRGRPARQHRPKGGPEARGPETLMRAYEEVA
jgi:hypothetical protein